MRSEGYGAVTSRRVAQAAGVKQQLVYYYFESMDDLLLATFKRRTARAIERLKAYDTMDRPLREIWEELIGRTDARLVFEFVALANHHDGVRAEVANFIHQAREAQADAIGRQMRESGADAGPLQPKAIAFLLFSVSLLLGREVATGITDGHDEVRAAAEWLLSHFE